ncbi:MAG: aldehyde ferredoxin oxidoreductase N-terminal domain-containing protein [Candidatus Adiutricales bacterium]
MLHGWMGSALEINLSTAQWEKTEFDSRLYESFLGGKGINARLFWDRVTPDVEPFSADNPIIISPGVLTGTMVPGANRAVFTFRSPQTSLHHYSALGGFWPAELKHAGYDNIVITGKSPTPVYIWIRDDKIEIRDAGHLWGKSTHQTKALIREDLNNNQVQVVSIGPAGENRVFGASLEDGTGASVSRCGIGAVFGDKNLKAIAVSGTQDIHIAEPQKLDELCQFILTRTDNLRNFYQHFAFTLNPALVRAGFFGNLSQTYRQSSPEFQADIKAAGQKCQDLIDKQRVREVSCYNCGLRCKHVYRRPDGGYSFIKCQSWIAFMTASKLIDYDFALKCYQACEAHGLDALAVARYVAMAIDLFERRILTSQDVDGLDLKWGNEDVVLSLIEKIAHREGIGDMLADGVHEAARRIGKGAEEFADTVKKVEPIPSSGGFDSYWGALVQAVSDKADVTRNMSIFVQGFWQAPKEIRENYISSGYCLYPEEYEQYLLEEFDKTGDNPEPTCQLVAYDEEMFTITDLTGLCNFWSCFMPDPPIHKRELKAKLISSVTGLDIDEAELTKIAKRIINLVRSCNVRLGLKREDDTTLNVYLKRVSSTTGRKKIDPEKFSKHLDRFYELRGWAADGIPTQETLEKSDLGFIVSDTENAVRNNGR